MWNPDRESVATLRKIRKRMYRLLRASLEATNQNKTDKTYQSLGYTTQELRSHIETHQNWVNAKDTSWHLDHIFPIQAFVEHNIIDPKIINALDNLQPLLAHENLSKGDAYNETDFCQYLSSKGIVVVAILPQR
jgi:5-methylcytosine-specific restriction endonuclease McrA